MSMQPARCINCGGSLKVDDVDLNGFTECASCHTPWRVIDVITIDGLPTVKNLLENAKLCIEDNDFEKAEKLFNEIIRTKANCHEAWWGLFVCQTAYDEYYGYEDKYGNRGPLIKASMLMSAIERYANRAIEYAPPQNRAEYEQAIKGDIDFIKRAQSGEFDSKPSFWKRIFG